MKRKKEFLKNCSIGYSKLKLNYSKVEKWLMIIKYKMGFKMTKIKIIRKMTKKI